MDGRGIFGGVLSLTLSSVLVTSVLIPTFRNTNTTGWTTAEITVFGLASLGAIFGLVYGVLTVFGVM